jgi:hypothetical protein
MSDDQKKIAATVALAVICLLALTVIATTLFAYGVGLQGETGPGAFLLAAMATMTDLEAMFWPAGIIVNAGLAIAGGRLATIRFSTVTICIVTLALIACLALYLLLVQPTYARPLWAYSDFESLSSYGQFRGALKSFLIWMAGSLFAALATLLGIVIPKARTS